jgi:hypothetical protein
MISTAGDKIMPGRAHIAEVTYEMGGAAHLSKIKIVK